MSHSHNKVVWQEGTFLSPQHFQQQERYLEHYTQQLFSSLHSGVAGFTRLHIDKEQLRAGKVFIREACGVFPDGTPFELNDSLVRDIKAANTSTLIYMALPLFRISKVDTASEESLSQSFRQKARFHTINDCTNEDNEETLELNLSTLNPSILLEDEPLNDYSILPIARIQEFSSSGELVLDSSFIPRCLDYRVSRYLNEQVQNLHALTQQRAAQLAQQVGVEAELKSALTMQLSYMWLQTLNRYGAALKQFEHRTDMTVAQLYYYLTVMAADLSTFTTTKAPDFPLFDENAIYESFAPVLSCLLLNLRQSSQEKVITISWDSSLYERRRLLRCQISDRTLFNDGRFILAVSSTMSIQEIRSTFITASKLCGHQRIADQVRNALPAITLTPLPSAPVELRSKSGTVYFDIELSDPLWQEMIRTHDLLALHIDKQMPQNTNIDLFVIR